MGQVFRPDSAELAAAALGVSAELPVMQGTALPGPVPPLTLPDEVRSIRAGLSARDSHMAASACSLASLQCLLFVGQQQQT